MSFSRLTNIALAFGLAAATSRAGGLLGRAIAGPAAIDSKGFIYIAGYASRDLPTTPAVLQSVSPPDCVAGSCPHGFVRSLRHPGTALYGHPSGPAMEPT
jgi:hypothetical protein